ncbi:MAG: hypothetical protein PHH26_08940 [Candidatus Thermoplasmatota archaeon]|nr:hypothetical protein [Candidatus Thermoplasmatota archaeon]
MATWKEVAKFASGVTAWETIVHVSLGLSGILPIALFGITITPTINAIQTIAPGLVSVALAYYGWKKK